MPTTRSSSTTGRCRKPPCIISVAACSVVSSGLDRLGVGRHPVLTTASSRIPRATARRTSRSVRIPARRSPSSTSTAPTVPLHHALGDLGEREPGLDGQQVAGHVLPGGRHAADCTASEASGHRCAMLPPMAIYGAAGNSSRVYLHRFLARAGREVRPGELVLDAGAGRAPYRDLFAHARYETADFLAVKGKKYVEPDYVCDLAQHPGRGRALRPRAAHAGARAHPGAGAGAGRAAPGAQAGRHAVAHGAAVLRRAREALRLLPLHALRAAAPARGRRLPRRARSSGWRATSAR